MYNKKKATDKPVGKSSGLNHSSSGKDLLRKSDSKDYFPARQNTQASYC